MSFCIYGVLWLSTNRVCFQLKPVNFCPGSDCRFDMAFSRRRGVCVCVCVCVCVWGGGVMAKYMPLCVHTVVIFCPCARLVNMAYWSYILARNFKLYRQASVCIVNLSIALQWIPERQRAEIINFTSQKFVWKETWKPSPWLSCVELLTPPSAHRVHGPPVFNYIWTPLTFQAHYSSLHCSRENNFKEKKERREQGYSSHSDLSRISTWRNWSWKGFTALRCRVFSFSCLFSRQPFLHGQKYVSFLFCGMCGPGCPSLVLSALI